VELFEFVLTGDGLPCEAVNLGFDVFTRLLGMKCLMLQFLEHLGLKLVGSVPNADHLVTCDSELLLALVE
jgi:hypothetical protein